MNRSERDDLAGRIRAASAALVEPGSRRESVLRRERLLALLAEYGDRLPRLVLSICPFTGKAYRRAIDPFGLDGPFWDARSMVPIDDPDPGPHFRLLLGAWDLRGRATPEVEEEVRPGPSVPFVVPDLLALPGMVAVIARMVIPGTEDIAYPIAYFSDQPTPPQCLHQEWGRLDYWFNLPGRSDAAWLVSNAEWDFDLDPWIARAKVFWIEPDLATHPPGEGPAPALVLRRASDPGAPLCPYANLPGERAPQRLLGGERDLLPLPEGATLNPFEE